MPKHEHKSLQEEGGGSEGAGGEREEGRGREKGEGEKEGKKTNEKQGMSWILYILYFSCF